MTSSCPRCKATIGTFTKRHRCRMRAITRSVKPYVSMTYLEKRRFQSRQGKFF